MTDNVTVVILAAGLGTRMRSGKAKVLHQAGGDTLLNHVIRAALQVARESGSRNNWNSVALGTRFCAPASRRRELKLVAERTFSWC